MGWITKIFLSASSIVWPMQQERLNPSLCSRQHFGEAGIIYLLILASISTSDYSCSKNAGLDNYVAIKDKEWCS